MNQQKSMKEHYKWQEMWVAYWVFTSNYKAKEEHKVKVSIRIEKSFTKGVKKRYV